MQKESANIAIIGAGNMGASLLGGLISQHYSPEKIAISDPDIEKLNALNKQFNVQTSIDNLVIIKKADIIILAVKPQIFTQVARSLVDNIQQRKPLIISVAAGITESSIQHCLGGSVPIVRCMPNIPALIGCGASALFANHYVSEQQKDIAETILKAVGMIVWLDDESLLNAVTGLSGSGPAYFFLMMEALQQAGEKLGLTPETARLLTLQTAFGAASMALKSEKNIIELRNSVTSPGGTTAEALQMLEKYNIREIMLEAVLAAKNRSEELAKLYN
ncbi:MAG: proC [Gammaproteobacteria bacterium]|jgi:pyrroline-5-carboxylate reductase|nr:proC [Gammaproteobacteria bacterium]